MIRARRTKVIQKEYVKRTPTPRLEYYVPHEQGRLDFGDSVLSGMGAHQKCLDSRFFYDERGSRIFDRICELPEYYLTRIESHMLGDVCAELAPMLPARCALVELGSGSATKTRIILEEMNRTVGDVTYFPIDVSNVLEESSRDLLESYSWINIVGVIDTYENGLAYLRRNKDVPALIAFLGSSLGNLDADSAHKFLCKISASMHDDDLFLIGLDLDKDESVLRCAYDDADGVTAEFNINILHRINAELGGNIDVTKFAHHIKYNSDERRIEMYLKSLEEQTVEILGRRFSLGRDELILTEYSHKYTTDAIHHVMQRASLDVRRIWKDDSQGYALVLCSRA